MIAIAAINKKAYIKSKVGCYSVYGKVAQMDCLQQQISLQIQKKFWFSRRRHSKKHLREKILSRVSFFLKKQEFDYQSVISLMKFPLKERKKILKNFSKLPGVRAPFTTVALERISGVRESRFCRGNKTDFYLKEICSLKVHKGKYF